QNGLIIRLMQTISYKHKMLSVRKFYFVLVNILLLNKWNIHQQFFLNMKIVDEQIHFKLRNNQRQIASQNAGNFSFRLRRKEINRKVFLISDFAGFAYKM